MEESLEKFHNEPDDFSKGIPRRLSGGITGGISEEPQLGIFGECVVEIIEVILINLEDFSRIPERVCGGPT